MKKLFAMTVVILALAGTAFAHTKQHRPPKPLHKNTPHSYTKHEPAHHPTAIHPHR
jgi:hypothetical protein